MNLYGVFGDKGNTFPAHRKTKDTPRRKGLRFGSQSARIFTQNHHPDTPKISRKRNFEIRNMPLNNRLHLLHTICRCVQKTPKMAPNFISVNIKKGYLAGCRLSAQAIVSTFATVTKRRTNHLRVTLSSELNQSILSSYICIIPELPNGSCGSRERLPVFEIHRPHYRYGHYLLKVHFISSQPPGAGSEFCSRFPPLAVLHSLLLPFWHHL